jgi:hypothetical protein
MIGAMMKTLLTLAACLSLTSCGSMKYISKEYSGVKVVKHQAPEMTVRIFDKPSAGKLMITPTIGKAAALGAGAGVTLGLWTPGLDPFPMQQAAQHYLDSTRRKCTITSGRLLIKPQWEFTYRDAASKPPVR